jgi:hypothetical protein
MRRAGLALDDAALAAALVGAPQIEPSIVQAAGPQAGQSAARVARLTPTQVSTRHWFEVATEPTPPAAALRSARAELENRLGADRDAASWCIAVPPLFDARSLSQVLAVLRAARVDVSAFVDAGAAVAAGLDLRRSAIVLDIGLHHLAATRVDVDEGEMRRRSALLRTRGGLMALYDGALRLISDGMVLRTRFDPLHDAENEQSLYDQLPGWLATVSAEGSVRVGLDARGERFEVELSRDQFVERAMPFYRELIAIVHELRPAGAALTIVLPELALHLPGLVESLNEFHGCELRVAPLGLAARAAQRIAVERTESGVVRLLRGVPRFEPPVLDAEEDQASGRIAPLSEDRAAPPTHLLWSGRAWELTGRALPVGRAPGAQGLSLPDGLAGVSRLHCTLRDDGEGIVLVEHSRYGTLVNGERVAGRVRLRAGDVVRVGDPGVELPLIAVGGGAVA